MILNGFTSFNTSKRHSSFLNYDMKLLHCQVDITATAVWVDLGACQTTMINFFAKKQSIIDVWKGLKCSFVNLTR